jgi:hypothetical protein
VGRTYFACIVLCKQCVVFCNILQVNGLCLGLLAVVGILIIFEEYAHECAEHEEADCPCDDEADYL